MSRNGETAPHSNLRTGVRIPAGMPVAQFLSSEAAERRN